MRKVLPKGVNVMRNRLALQSELELILGSANVYFQPPSSVSLKYPCIIYELNQTDVIHGDNKKYIKHNEYQVKHIYKSLKNELKDKILDKFFTISHDTRYVADNLYHDVFTLYY